MAMFSCVCDSFHCFTFWFSIFVFVIFIADWFGRTGYRIACLFFSCQFLTFIY